MSRFENLREVAKDIPTFDADLEVDLLIGSNNPAAFQPLQVVPIGGKGPYAMHLRHGWTLSGPVQVRSNADCSSVTSITVREVKTVKDVSLLQSMQRMFEADFDYRD